MKVSIIMITYGHERFIRKAVEGVLMQEADFEYELVVANDNSPDQTANILKEIINSHPRGSRIKVINRTQNIGMQPNFIDAYQQCKGNYIALCEGDDYWTDPLKLQKQVGFLEGNPSYVLCFHKMDILMPDGNIVDDFITNVPKEYENLGDLARSGNYIHTPSVLFRNIIQNFPYEFQLTPIGDFFLYMMLAEKGKIHHMPEKMCVYRYGVGVFSNKSQVTKIKATNKLYTCLLSYLTDVDTKKIILQRQMKTLDILGDTIESGFSSGFVLNNKFFRSLKYISQNFFEPSKIAGKLQSKLNRK